MSPEWPQRGRLTCSAEDRRLMLEINENMLLLLDKIEGMLGEPNT
jgi:hypothetical protein